MRVVATSPQQIALGALSLVVSFFAPSLPGNLKKWTVDVALGLSISCLLWRGIICLARLRSSKAGEGTIWPDHLAASDGWGAHLPLLALARVARGLPEPWFWVYTAFAGLVATVWTAILTTARLQERRTKMELLRVEAPPDAASRRSVLAKSDLQNGPLHSLMAASYIGLAFLVYGQWNLTRHFYGVEEIGHWFEKDSYTATYQVEVNRSEARQRLAAVAEVRVVRSWVADDETEGYLCEPVLDSSPERSLIVRRIWLPSGQEVEAVWQETIAYGDGYFLEVQDVQDQIWEVELPAKPLKAKRPEEHH